MKLRVLCAVLTAIGLSACTTVDLSQISAAQTKETISVPAPNIVKRASHKLTKMFFAKGWCKSSPQEKTQTAASVLLNGLGGGNAVHGEIDTTVLNAVTLAGDMRDARAEIIRTTKAAEVYLSMATETTVLGAELSSLEAALLSAREAQSRFERSVSAHQTRQNKDEYLQLALSVDALKTVTDAYGARLRNQIMSTSTNTQS